MEARMNLFASERLMKRAAHTDTQMEEHVHTPHAACRVTCVVVCCVVMCVVRSVIDDVYLVLTGQLPGVDGPAGLRAAAVPAAGRYDVRCERR
jgi:hypothetical protein